jgi:hypothetical protein
MVQELAVILFIGSAKQIRHDTPQLAEGRVHYSKFTLLKDIPDIRMVYQKSVLIEKY